MDPAKFKQHFVLEGADWFPERLLAFFLECQKQAVKSDGKVLTLEGFREGGEGGCGGCTRFVHGGGCVGFFFSCVCVCVFFLCFCLCVFFGVFVRV